MMQSRGIFFAVALFTLACPYTSSGQNLEFRFERMWPALQQPWYFDGPYDVAVDPFDIVYVTDGNRHRVVKFSTDGRYVGEWGRQGTASGEFNRPTGIAANDTHVYVADQNNHRVQKFTRDGDFVLLIGEEGSGPGQFFNPEGVGVDSQGFVYVVDRSNARIQKFSAVGDPLLQWGTSGSGLEQFSSPKDLAIDANDFIYVADSRNDRVQKFTGDGQFVLDWGTEGTQDGQFQVPLGIAVDGQGFVYVSDGGTNDRVQKFTSAGLFQASWGSGDGLGEFNFAAGLAFDAAGFAYLAYRLRDRIPVFAPPASGLATDAHHAATQWSSAANTPGRLDGPADIAIDSAGDLYVSDNLNARVQKFSANGNLLAEWNNGTGGAFSRNLGIAIDAQNFLYVSDADRRRVQKFGPVGSGSASAPPSLIHWLWDSAQNFGFLEVGAIEGIAVNTAGVVFVADSADVRIQRFDPPANGQPGSPHEFAFSWDTATQDVAVDSLGRVFATDSSAIQVFDSNGQLLDTWGQPGTGPGEFDRARGLAVDSQDRLYVSDPGIDRLSVFTSAGSLVTQYGETGSIPGALNGPAGMAIGADGKLYVTEPANDRVSALTPAILSSSTKVIVVAGGGPYAGNALWDATQLNANFAIRVLRYQGFTKGTFHYLSADLNLDLDGNGLADDVDADATAANLQDAIENWAADADELLVYLIDHGGSAAFRISGTETLSAQSLDDWLDTWQSNTGGDVTIVYDACQSGSFLSALSLNEQQRVVITSARDDENAYFVSQGTLSFSNHFWTQVFNGLSLADSFTLASASQSSSFPLQNPILDANGDGTGDGTDLAAIQNRFIGNGTSIVGQAPVIGSVSVVQDMLLPNSATITASNVTDADGIARAWVVMRPPGFNPGSPDNPVSDLPSFDLLATGNDDFQARFDGFSDFGTYLLTVYALDNIGNTAVPKLTTVTVNNPLDRRAVVIVGGETTDPEFADFASNAGGVYRALEEQGYGTQEAGLCSGGGVCDLTCDNVCYLSSAGSAGSDTAPSLANIHEAVSNWGAGNTQDLTLYLVGKETGGSYRINATENLTATALKSLIDTAQLTVPGTVTVIVEGDNSQAFVEQLAPDNDASRILIASAGSGESAAFLLDGEISFSGFFWSQVLNGATVNAAFKLARQSIRFNSNAQNPQLDDNGNGVTNDLLDGLRARFYSIGSGVLLAGDQPVVAGVQVAMPLVNQFENITATSVTSTGTIDRVVALVTQPDQTLVEAELLIKDGVYATANSAALCGGSGNYDIAVYAVDSDGQVSIPATASTSRSSDCERLIIFADGFE